MFQRLHDLSLAFSKRESWQRLNEGMPIEYKVGVCLHFDGDGAFTDVQTFHSPSNVIYRSGPSNGTDFTPCCKFSEKTKNTMRRLLRATTYLRDYSRLPIEKRDWLNKCISAVESDLDNITEQIEEKKASSDLSVQKRAYLFMAKEDEPVFLWPEAKEFMVSQFLETFSHGGIRDGVCVVCGMEKDTVYGNFSVLACYNLDKRGSIAGGFLEDQAHRNFPVCADCAFDLAEAYVFANTNLTSSMAGQSYIVLPNATTPEIRDEVLAILTQQPKRFRLGKVRDLVGEEIELIEEFGQRGDQIAFSLIFFRAKNNEWRIQAEVQQVLPSRMKCLHESAVTLRQAKDLFTITKNDEKPFQVSAQTIRRFSGTTEKSSADTFRTWLVTLFEGKELNYQFFLKCLSSTIIDTSRSNPGMIAWITREAWGLYRYAGMTGLIKIKQYSQEERMQEVIPDSVYGRYIQQHRDFFNSPELVTAFLTGCYCSQTASVQRQERGSDPFTKKFIGRLLNRKHLQRLYREGHAKLAQYGKLGYVMADLDPDLAAAWITCGDQWNANDEESSFAFTIGYSLAWRIRQLDQVTSQSLEENK